MATQVLESDPYKPAAETVGTRPGLLGQTLISTGHADLDRLLGGGLPLGCVLLVLEDAWTPHGTTLLKYFAAEGAAWGHRLLWARGRAGASVKLPKLVVGKGAGEVRPAPSCVPSQGCGGWLLCKVTLAGPGQGSGGKGHARSDRLPHKAAQGCHPKRGAAQAGSQEGAEGGGPG